MLLNRKSAIERLRELPDVFTLNTAAALLKLEPGNASTYIARWKESGLVSSLGPRTGVHFNLLKNPLADKELRMEAIAYLFPGAVIGGVSAVHAAGWTTQFPRQTEIMIPKRRSFPAVEDAAISMRPLPWMRAAKNWVSQEGVVPWLNPAFALADCIDQNIWRPDPDDIEWDEVNVADLRLAFHQFSLEMPEEWSEELEYLGQNADQGDLLL
ncbi:hypothetical protein LCGC14_0227970 [marine sediment metagenome]|uniref:Uncharacterized protein n=1 Tax=marine sediment metagenome TaxID=412755 RepID=A0A0F9XF20_9ZZZZ